MNVNQHVLDDRIVLTKPLVQLEQRLVSATLVRVQGKHTGVELMKERLVFIFRTHM